jgi:hypothetical protein
MKTGFLIKHFSWIPITGIVILILVSCRKDNKDIYSGLIPDVPVNFYIQPNTIDFLPAGSWRYYDNEGYRGVIVYRIDQYVFMAYERTCPYDPQNECAIVEVDPASYTLIDSCCMSRYLILDGMPFSGPSSLPLKQYFTDFNGNYLHVYNNP